MEQPHLYSLFGSIVHLGKGAGGGHYISYVECDGKWVYFNDRKVCISEHPEIEKSFMLIFKRLDK